MKFNINIVAVAAALFGTTALGHLMIKSPVPFGVESLNNSPLENAAPGTSTSDWPCKQRTGVYDITSMNYMKVGEPQLLSFIGSATHGGGTMQLAYTKDFNPTANSEFKLFQTFQGDAPASATGDPTAKDFTYILPAGTPNGNLTFAWIWYNRIGNREIYMNCAPLSISGGSDTDDYYNSLPNAYIINLPTSECGSADSKDVIIPNPGQYISKGDASYFATATGSACGASAAAQTKGVSGLKTNIVSNGASDKAPATNGDSTGPAPTGGAASQPTAGGAGAASSSPAASQPAMTSAAPTSQASPSGGEIGKSATIAASSAPLVTISTAAPSPVAPTMASSNDSVATSAPSAGMPSPSYGGSGGGAASPSGTGSSSSGSGSGAGTGTCSNNGAVVCNGPNLFGLCNSGSVVWQPVAAGTTCSNGQVTKRSVLRHAHVRRHVQNVGKHL